MTMRRTVSPAALALIAAVGCENRAAETPPPANPTSASAAVDSVMLDHFGAFERGDIATWSDILADDVFFTAAGPADVFDSRDSTRGRMERDVGRVKESGIQLTIRPLSHSTWTANHGRTAATIYDFDYRISYQEQNFSYRLRSAYLLEQDTGSWKVRAAQYSRPIPYDTLFMALVQHRVPPAFTLPGHAPPASTNEVIQRFRADIGDISSASLAGDVVVVSPGTILQGATNARRELAQWLGPAGSATQIPHGVRAGLDASGTVGWVATNLNVPIFAGPESAIAPMRALFVYRRIENGWEVVQASLSVGLREGS